MKKALLAISIMFLISGCDINPNASNDQSSITEERTTPIEGKKGKSESELSLASHFFNEVMEVDGKSLIQNPDNMLILVNKMFSLPQDYSPDDLIRPNVVFSFGDQDVEKSYMRREAAMALERMFVAAAIDGIELFAVSGYRSYERQNINFQNHVNRLGEDEAVKVAAYPGNSEHQTGLAMDISSQSANFLLTEQFGDTLEGKWLMENAHKYGFILRYPKGMEAITGYQYEPWHYRYVGVEIATEIYERQLTLEEYFNIVEKI
ncbi:M15 family metallopeptidase [Niallia sp. XMNu-256]|uniref:M15 family metallopeptidase n=1 Tax=Niallia sp. XMNu-256 TaxID=3082444 RepID=UPI0030CDAB5E